MTAAPVVQVRGIRPAEVPAGVMLLARHLAALPALQWAVPDPAAGDTAMRVLARRSLGCAIFRGSVDVAVHRDARSAAGDGAVVGVAVTAYQPRTPRSELLPRSWRNRSDLAELPDVVFDRLCVIGRRDHDRRPSYHRYAMLHWLAVNDDQSYPAIGAALLHTLHDRLDARRLGCYTEAHDDQTSALLRPFGYHDLDDRPPETTTGARLWRHPGTTPPAGTAPQPAAGTTTRPAEQP